MKSGRNCGLDGSHVNSTPVYILAAHAMRHQTKVEMQFDYFTLISARRSSKKRVPAEWTIYYLCWIEYQSEVSWRKGKIANRLANQKVATNETSIGNAQACLPYAVDSNFQVSTWNAIEIFMSNCSSDKLIDCQSTDNYTCTNDCTVRLTYSRRKSSFFFCWFNSKFFSSDSYRINAATFIYIYPFRRSFRRYFDLIVYFWPSKVLSNFEKVHFSNTYFSSSRR